MIEDDFSNNIVVFVRVKRLPRDALIELEILAHVDCVTMDKSAQKSQNAQYSIQKFSLNNGEDIELPSFDLNYSFGIVWVYYVENNEFLKDVIDRINLQYKGVLALLAVRVENIDQTEQDKIDLLVLIE